MKNKAYILLLVLSIVCTFEVKAQEFPIELFNRIYDLSLDTGYSTSDNPYEVLADNQEDFIYLLLTDEPSLFYSFHEREALRKDAIEESKAAQYVKDYCLSEIDLQWSLLYWRFGDYLRSGVLLRRAYKRLIKIQEEHPDFIEVNKSLGLLHILLSAIPNEYDWIIKLFGFQNNQELGMREISQAVEEDNQFQSEAKLLLAYVYIFVLNKDVKGKELIESIKEESKLNSFGYIVMCNKAGWNEEGLEEIYLDQWIHTSSYLRPSLSLLRGELHLKKLELEQAILNLKGYLLTFNGRAFIDNTQLKLFFAYFLNGDKEKAGKIFSNPDERGTEFSTSDIYARNVFSQGKYPDQNLLKARLLFDGGYYEKSLKETQLYAYKSNRVEADQYEYYYRLGRVQQKLDNPDKAILAFNKCIDIQVSERYYFAPNACLQLGRIYQEMGNRVKALEFFDKALTYKKYAYRRSIEHQAKAAINEIR